MGAALAKSSVASDTDHAMKSLNAKHFVLDFTLARQAVPSFKQYPFNLPAVAKSAKS